MDRQNENQNEKKRRIIYKKKKKKKKYVHWQENGIQKKQ